MYRSTMCLLTRLYQLLEGYVDFKCVIRLRHLLSITCRFISRKYFQEMGMQLLRTALFQHENKRNMNSIYLKGGLALVGCKILGKFKKIERI